MWGPEKVSRRPSATILLLACAWLLSRHASAQPAYSGVSSNELHQLYGAAFTGLQRLAAAPPAAPPLLPADTVNAA
jgi:hypothetical protein